MSGVDHDTPVAEMRNDRRALMRDLFSGGGTCAAHKTKPIVDRIINGQDNDPADVSTTDD